MRILLITITALLISTTGWADESGDTVALPRLTEQYYQSQTFLTHSYDYELVNRKRRLQKQASDVNAIGSSLTSIVSLFGGMIASNAGWKEGVYIPSAVILELGGIWGLSVWSRHIQEKADEITLPELPRDTMTTQAQNMLLNSYAQSYGLNSTNYADALMWCARKCLNYGDQKQAQQLMKRSCQMWQQYGKSPFEGRDTISEIFYRDLRSELELISNRDYQALRNKRRATELKRLYFGQQSEAYLTALLSLSQLYAERLKHRKSERLHNEGYQTYVELIKREFCQSSETERTNYWNKAITYISRTVDLAHQAIGKGNDSSSPNLSAAAYNALLLSKGLLLNTSISFENYIKQTGNTEAVALLTTKKSMSASGAPQAKLDSMDYAILHALQSAGQEYNIPQLSVTWKDVACQLGPDDLAIEFYRTSTGAYGAILLRHDWKAPRMVRLGSIIQQNGHYLTLAQSLARRPFETFTPDDCDNIWTVSRAVWPDALVKHFPTTREGRVYFSADGQLLVTGIEYLPFVRPNHDFHAISDLYHVYRLSSTRELVIGHDVPQSKEMDIYGGLRYDMSEKDIVDDMQKYPEQYNYDNYLAQNTARYAEQEDTIIEYLKGTLREAEQIKASVNGLSNSPLHATLYTDHQGTEASLKALDGKHHRIIHIGTHGFYYTIKDSLIYGRFLPNEAKERPLLRSGLFMAGANRRYQGKAIPRGADDGILTAQEVSTLDLSGLDLVTLSACETGQGEIDIDGVFGLQRGFKMASAQSILMSLWKVDDEATCLLMTEFYKNWISEGKSKHDSLELAKQAVRSHKEKGWNDPKYWAAFILLDGLD